VGSPESQAESPHPGVERELQPSTSLNSRAWKVLKALMSWPAKSGCKCCKQYVYASYLRDGEIKSQRVQETCPRSLNLAVAT
jgi:hypothetical protein